MRIKPKKIPRFCVFLNCQEHTRSKTPIGDYEPDFGIIVQKKNLGDDGTYTYHFIVETKGTNDLNDGHALTPSEAYKIRCAIEHFKTIGVQYIAPVKDYDSFTNKSQAKEDMTDG